VIPHPEPADSDRPTDPAPMNDVETWPPEAGEHDRVTVIPAEPLVPLDFATGDVYISCVCGDCL
jgi:hypothetical protein